MKKFNIILFLLLTTLISTAQTTPVKIVFDVTSPDTKIHKSTLRHVNAMAKNYPNSEFEVVVYSGAGVRGYGNLILIKHNQDYLSAYAFNQRNLVKDGTKVYAGQEIAEMGRNNAGQVLLHFEIRHNGLPVNPLRYLR